MSECERCKLLNGIEHLLTLSVPENAALMEESKKVLQKSRQFTSELRTLNKELDELLKDCN